MNRPITSHDVTLDGNMAEGLCSQTITTEDSYIQDSEGHYDDIAMQITTPQGQLDDDFKSQATDLEAARMPLGLRSLFI